MVSIQKSEANLKAIIENSLEILGLEQSRKLKYKYDEFGLLIDLLQKRDLPEDLVNPINQNIEGTNSLSGSNKELLKQVRSVNKKSGKDWLPHRTSFS